MSDDDLIADLRKALIFERQQAKMWRSQAVRWACCKAGLVAAPDPCPWHDAEQSPVVDVLDEFERTTIEGGDT
jgi:hypothetical protein